MRARSRAAQQPHTCTSHRASHDVRRITTASHRDAEIDPCSPIPMEFELTDDTMLAPIQGRATRNVLLVDDDHEFVTEATSALEAAGYTVTTSPSGSPAQAALAQLRPDVVIADAATTG